MGTGRRSAADRKLHAWFVDISMPGPPAPPGFQPEPEAGAEKARGERWRDPATKTHTPNEKQSWWRHGSQKRKN